MSTEIISRIRKLSSNEFDWRYDKVGGCARDMFDDGMAEVYFEREILLMFLRYTLEKGMDEDTAYHTIEKDRDTLNAVFSDATTMARFGCY